MKALVFLAISTVFLTPVAFPGETVFADGFEAPRTCWAGGGFVGKLDLCFDTPFGQTPPVGMETAEAFTEIPRADLIIGLDTTGSMAGEIANLKSAATTILDEFLRRSQDGAVSIAGYDDYPYAEYGILDQGDRAFYLLHRSMTASTPAGKASITSAINAFTTHHGGDLPESGWEMVKQVATGAGSGSIAIAVPPFNPLTAPPVSIPEGEETGEIGGVGIRYGSMPILVWITDAPSHNSGVTGNYYQPIPGVVPATSAQALVSMKQIGGRIIGVMSGENARPDLTLAAVETKAILAPQAWGTESRPPGCAPSQCCTGINGAGVLPVAGNCPLVFAISADGSGLGTAIIDGIEHLLTSTSFDIGADLVDDPIDGIDAVSAFVDRVVADNSAPYPCTQGLTAIDMNGDSVPDTFIDVAPGSIVCFNVVLKTNQTVPPTSAAQYFSANLQIISDAVTILETRGVHFRVPAF